MPIIRRTYCVYVTHPNQQTRQPSIQSEKYQCHIDTVSSADDGGYSCLKHVEKLK